MEGNAAEPRYQICLLYTSTLNTIQTRVNNNYERIEDMQRREISRMREEIENIGNRPAVVSIPTRRQSGSDEYQRI